MDLHQYRRSDDPRHRLASRCATAYDGAQHLAAAHALAPFASGNPQQLKRPSKALARQDISYAYTQSYFKYAGKDAKVSNNYLVRKLYYARQSMRLFHTAPQAWDSIQRVTVAYEHPFYFPLVGRLLGSTSSTAPGVRVFNLKYTAPLQNEGAKRADQKLGIKYDSDY